MDMDVIDQQQEAIKALKEHHDSTIEKHRKEAQLIPAENQQIINNLQADQDRLKSLEQHVAAKSRYDAQ
eukprot:14533491-Heterocapsa_arctica.AAC.1